MRVQHSGNGVEPVRCIPKSRLSRDYDLEWDNESIEVSFSTFGDGGKLKFKDSEYEIDVKGPLGRIWTLREDRDPVMTAERHGIRSAIIIERDGEQYSLERKHLLSSEFLLSAHNEVIADFEKPKLLNRKLEIHVLDVEADFLTLAFAFWMVTDVRRAATGKRRV
ncbi:MAG: hypothetical protein HKN33_17745 [Pyrinomonadaceae bacterium]|nr:hypothetical protein [Pyrinomonadaceae bacterium]